MAVLSKNMSQLIDKYKFWICRNPDKVRFMENYSSLVLSILAGKLTKSNIPYDWITLGTRLLTFFNNHIMNAPPMEDIPNSNKIKIFTTILEYAEVSFERTVQSISGESAKWKLIVFLQCFKLFVKLMVRLYYKERIVCCPYSYLPDDEKENDFGIQDESNGYMHDVNTHFVLKRSRRVVRMVHSAPPLYGRLWKPPVVDIHSNASNRRAEKLLLVGELLYLFKPIVTIGAMKKYGYGTWKPWTVSLLMDLISLYLIQRPYLNRHTVVNYTPYEREEIGRRVIGILSYFMKSPFYELHTRDRLKATMSVIPVLGQVLSNHLDFYLQTYFFLWSK